MEELSKGQLDLQLQEFCSNVVETAAECAPQVKSRKKKGLWSMDLQKAAADSKRAHFQWKQAGKPGREHPLSIQRTKGKGHLRTLQRQQQAEYRSSVYNELWTLMQQI